MEKSETTILIFVVVRGAVAGSGEEDLFNVFAETVLLLLAIATNGVLIIYLLMVN
jgi:hypothetical protein